MAQKKPLQWQSFRQSPKMDQNSVQKLLSNICKAIDEIYAQNCSNLSFEELYRTAYNLVLQKQGDLLYDRVREALTLHLKSSVTDILNKAREQFLPFIVKQWLTHQTAFRMTKDVLMYVDRSYCHQKKKAEILPMALQLFREVVVYHPVIRERLRNNLLEHIHNERRGYMIDREVMKETLKMLQELGIGTSAVYDEEFEQYFLQETEKFYRVESLEYISINSSHDYMSKVELRLSEEAHRVSNYLSSDTEPRLKAILENELLTTHAKSLIDMENSGLVVMLRDHKVNDLKRLYNLFARVSFCLDLLRDHFGYFIVKNGEEILSQQENNKDPILFVANILQLKDKMDEIIKNAFHSDKKMQKKLKESFEKFINQDNRSAQYLVAYVDDFLRNGIQNLSESNIDDQLNKVIVIFKFLTDKDLFENYYKNYLCKRLLTGKSISDEMERNMIAKLKAECGYQYTSKLEGMFLDMNISRSAMDDYRRSAQASSAPVELDIQLLTTGYWPLQPTPPCRLPPILDECCELFKSFYLQKNSGRKLTWFMHMSSADIKVNE